ncbi:Peptidase_S10 domain-containing protein [Cephalotus follicularis]|uniref:Carboxypeptidase n=1 Tax=Cephalotus follicularis TaxID=3775 RepID=A0A1Q3BWK0_CEPFO|nr:Peptidase_S10 domain-containing protein [Cephalotus follicularis]
MAKLLSLLCFSSLVYTLLVNPTTIAATKREDSGERREADRVTNLPGQPAVTFGHFSGYVKLRPHDQKALFYWFFEAQSDVSRRPLVLWLNGGPGCSSVAFGAAQELGPFLIRSNQTNLTLNQFSWNKVANMLFLEAPVGVGFSYTNNSKDLNVLGDQVTANDSHAFLISWFNRFPSFKSHDFYIAGESYAGHYVPQLADLIYERNKRASKDSRINFKGFMIGNAVINDLTDTSGFVDYGWSHAIISDHLYNKINKECEHFKQNDQSIQCSAHIRDLMEAYSDIDIFSIYTPICLNSLDGKTRPKFIVAPRLLTQHDHWQRLPSGYDPCTENYVETYFNRADVQWALHANVTKLSYPYTTCSEVIRTWTDSTDTVLPIIQKFLNTSLRIWIYSGDTDGRVPVTSTRYSINKMGLTIEEEWRAWFHKSQVAGWVETYEGGLTLATVRGAGHQVPVFAADQSLSLFTHFLSAKTLPSSRF